MQDHPTRDARELEAPLVFFIGLVLFVFLPMMVPITTPSELPYAATIALVAVISLALLAQSPATDHLWVDYAMMVGFHFLYFWPA